LGTLEGTCLMLFLAKFFCLGTFERLFQNLFYLLFLFFNTLEGLL
jgi:hypothetical protein